MRDKLKDKVQCLVGNRGKVQEDALAAVALAAMDHLQWDGSAPNRTGDAYRSAGARSRTSRGHAMTLDATDYRARLLAVLASPCVFTAVHDHARMMLAMLDRRDAVTVAALYVDASVALPSLKHR